MENNQRPALGERIRQIRDAKGMSIETLAQEINSNKSTVSRMERGETSVSAENMAKIRKALDIEDAPLLENELEPYTSRIWVWYDMISADRLVEAKAMQGEMQVITHLPYEHNLIGIYMMTEARLLAKSGNPTGMEERLNQVEQYLNNASKELLHIYHRNMGYFLTATVASKSKPKEALKHNLKALEYENDHIKADAQIYLNIGAGYYLVCDPVQSIIYLERAQRIMEPGRLNLASAYIYGKLASTYTDMGKFATARRLLGTCIAVGKSLNADFILSYALKIMAKISIREEKHDEALEYILQAEKHTKDHPYMLTVVLIDKADILYKLKRTDESKALMTQIKAQGNEEYNYAIDIQEHRHNINNSDSAKYLETVIIPTLIAEKNGESMFRALDICKELEAHYLKKNAKTKAMAIAVVARDIYAELFTGERDV